MLKINDYKLKFSHVEYSIQTKSVDIYNLGCDANPRCKGCFNPELWDWNLSGKDYTQVIAKTTELIGKYPKLIDRIILVGGDPVDAYNRYKEEYLEFVQGLKTLDRPIFLFTRHQLPNVPKELLQEVQYVKTGCYVPELTVDNNICFGIKLATSNQTIVKLEKE